MTAKLTIGMDPEVVIVDKADHLVRAGDYIRREAKFGLDGHTQQYLTELRPDPAIHPRTLTKNLKSVLQSGMKHLGQFRWWGGAWQFDQPLGGHIHFGCTKTTKIVEALDNQVAPLLTLIEPEEQARTRRTRITFRDRPYGQLSDVRDKTWGFEWRTPGSFIVTPGTTMGLLSIAKAAVIEELEGGECAFSKLSAAQLKELKFTAKDFNEANRAVFELMIDPLWKLYRGMRYFQEGQEGADAWSTVAYLKHKVAQNSYNSNRDLKKSWKLEEEKAVPLVPGEVAAGGQIVFADPMNPQPRIIQQWADPNQPLAVARFDWAWAILRRDPNDPV